MKTMFKRMNRRAMQVISLYLAGVMSLAATQAWAVTMEDIDFSSLPGDRTEIRMRFDSAPPDPKGYTIEQPARIVLDLPGVVSGLKEKHHNLGIGNARRVSVVSTKDRTRAIVNLTQLVSYETSVEGNTLVLLVGAGGGATQPVEAQTMELADDRAAPAAAGGSVIEMSTSGAVKAVRDA